MKNAASPLHPLTPFPSPMSSPPPMLLKGTISKNHTADDAEIVLDNDSATAQSGLMGSTQSDVSNTSSPFQPPFILSS